jgi:benzoyl-CoA reductase/2-hydroxyglutaryl-CoA dehydratase subunit BcrC/BadD/HgdB
MDTSISQARSELLPKIEESQQEFRQAIEELETAVKRGIDPRAWIVERPLPFLIGGLLFGFWLGVRRR